MELLRYFPDKTFFQMAVLPFIMFRPNLHNKVLLKSYVNLKPRPPRDLGLQMDLQDFDVKFFDFSGGKPQQNLEKALSIFLVIVFGISRVDMA